MDSFGSDVFGRDASLWRHRRGWSKLFERPRAASRLSTGGGGSKRGSPGKLENAVAGATGMNYNELLMVQLMELLRLLCEDHYTPIQNYFRAQPDNLRSYNLCEEVVTYLQVFEADRRAGGECPRGGCSPAGYLHRLVPVRLWCDGRRWSG